MTASNVTLSFNSIRFSDIFPSKNNGWAEKSFSRNVVLYPYFLLIHRPFKCRWKIWDEYYIIFVREGFLNDFSIHDVGQPRDVIPPINVKFQSNQLRLCCNNQFVICIVPVNYTIDIYFQSHFKIIIKKEQYD